MSKKICTLDGRRIDSEAAFYDEIARQLGFPVYFGRNLDALWDVLTVDVEGPVDIIWNDSDESRRTMGTRYEKIIMLLDRVAKSRGDLKLILR